MATSSSKVFLQFAVGDLEAHATAEQQFKKFQDFVKARGASFGLPETVGELDEAGMETMKSMFEAEHGDEQYLAAPPPSPVVGRAVFELWTKDCPKTAENFRALCTGEKGIGKGHNKPMHFQHTQMHRIVPGAFLHGGDYTRLDGSGGASIYSGGSFNDEKPGLKFKHDVPGLLSMANSGKNSNTSQFFVTLGACPKLDGKHVVFGKVADAESLAVVEKVEKLCQPDVKRETPGLPITIVDCGELGADAGVP